MLPVSIVDAKREIVFVQAILLLHSITAACHKNRLLMYLLRA